MCMPIYKPVQGFLLVMSCLWLVHRNQTCTNKLNMLIDKIKTFAH